MSYMALYRKWRPEEFEDVKGQEHIVTTLKNQIKADRVGHAYLFCGTRGTGKTTIAKLFAKAVNCSNPKEDNSPCGECESCMAIKKGNSLNVIEIDAASNNGVDNIREIREEVAYRPTQGKYKVYIIDEVHMLTASAFNALLLTLEEPPSHVVFILATTDIQDVPITILSRCQRFDFKPVNKIAIVNRLKHVCTEESIKITDEALEEIALISAGGMRDALGMLDQLSSDDSEITLEMVSDYFGSVSVKKIDELLTAIEGNNVDSLLEVLKVVKESGTNYTVFIEKLISELRKCAIGIKSGKYKHDMYFEDIYGMIFDLNECLCNININIDSYVLIEIVLLKYINVGNNYKSDLGNNFNTSSNGFVFSEDKSKNIVKNDEKVTLNISPDKLGNTKKADISAKKSAIEQLENNVDKKGVINKKNINKVDLSVRINNCFVDASKTMKENISKSWVDFMNYLMTKDRSLISLLADTVILTASSTYALIQSKIDSTNELINMSIKDLEKYYGEFSGNKLKFAAINEDLWLKETEKYRFNLKNKIKYSYIDEPEEENNDSSDEVVTNVNDDIEEVAKDIFGSFEVE